MTTRDIATPAPLMAGKRGLVMGVANDRSIAWGIARVLAGQGAKLAFTYQGEAFGRRAIPLAESVNSEIIVMDEMISAGDAYFIAKAQRRLSELLDRVKVVVVATHDMAVMQGFCNRLVWLDRGEIRGIGRFDEIYPNYLATVASDNLPAPQGHPR